MLHTRGYPETMQRHNMPGHGCSENRPPDRLRPLLRAAVGYCLSASLQGTVCRCAFDMRTWPGRPGAAGSPFKGVFGVGACSHLGLLVTDSFLRSSLCLPCSQGRFLPVFELRHGLRWRGLRYCFERLSSVLRLRIDARCKRLEGALGGPWTTSAHVARSSGRSSGPSLRRPPCAATYLQHRTTIGSRRGRVPIRLILLSGAWLPSEGCVLFVLCSLFFLLSCFRLTFSPLPRTILLLLRLLLFLPMFFCPSGSVNTASWLCKLPSLQELAPMFCIVSVPWPHHRQGLVLCSRQA